MTSPVAKRKFVIDCDTGTDDAQAIILLLSRNDVELLAVLAVFGNTTLENTTYNALRVLNVCQRFDIPVFKGCERSLIGLPSPDSGYHGFDGLGDVPGEYNADKELLQKKHASVALLELVNKYPGEITLVVTGPLTNIAVAMQLDPELGSKLKECFIMGGSLSAAGNITVCAEFNFYCDPEAAKFVLHNLGSCRIVLATKEVCEDNFMTWDEYDKFIGQGSRKCRFIQAIDKVVIASERARRTVKDYLMVWDPFTAALAVDNSVALETIKCYVTVELQGQYTRGQLVVDRLGKLGKLPNVELVVRGDREKYHSMMNAAVIA